MWHFLFGFSGRLSRASFCLFATVAFVGLLVLFSALYFYQISAGNYENGGPVPWPSSPLGIAGATLWFCCQFVILIAALAVSTKRLHDRGKPAWWLLVFALLPNALYSLAQYWQDTEPSSPPELVVVIHLVALALFLWAFVELACLRGTSGTNRFGPDPLMRAG